MDGDDHINGDMDYQSQPNGPLTQKVTSILDGLTDDRAERA
jgi:hypothetical protein